MRTVFADTLYWQALANPRDQWHDRATAVSRSMAPVRIITTDEVLIEFLAAFCRMGAYWRAKAAQLVRRVLDDPNVQVVAQSRTTLLAGLELYESRRDKAYSPTDCISMQTMRRQAVMEVLTHDKHFAQEGFTILLNGQA
jgi:uncharacterized protein